MILIHDPAVALVNQILQTMTNAAVRVQTTGTIPQTLEGMLETSDGGYAVVDGYFAVRFYAAAVISIEDMVITLGAYDANNDPARNY